MSWASIAGMRASSASARCRADAAERDLEAFRWLAIADAAIGFLNEAQRQHRAVLNQLGNLPHRLAGVAQRQAPPNGGEGGQGASSSALIQAGSVRGSGVVVMAELAFIGMAFSLAQKFR